MQQLFLQQQQQRLVAAAAQQQQQAAAAQLRLNGQQNVAQQLQLGAAATAQAIQVAI